MNPDVRAQWLLHYLQYAARNFLLTMETSLRQHLQAQDHIRLAMHEKHETRRK